MSTSKKQTRYLFSLVPDGFLTANTCAHEMKPAISGVNLNTKLMTRGLLQEDGVGISDSNRVHSGIVVDLFVCLFQSFR
jgi:hypothetical protein